MSPEVPSEPKKEPEPSTPESIQECLILAMSIDTQVLRWQGYAHHPRMQSISFAKFVADDCAPLDRPPIDYLPQADFGGTLTREDARLRTAYEERRVLLSEWVQKEELDTLPISNKPVAEFFQTIAEFTANPSLPEEYRTSIQALRRLFILREQLNTKIKQLKKIDASAFMEVGGRIIDEL